LFSLEPACRHIADIAFVGLSLLAITGCATTGEVRLVPTPSPPQPDILHLRIANANLKGLSMTVALRQLSNDIKTQTGGKLTFDYSMRIGMAAQVDYARRNIPVEQWKMRDPKIHVQAHDVTLDGLLHEMCFQSGWTYTTGAPGLHIPGISFSDRPDNLVPLRSNDI
jgi:hypothetical protein